MSKLAMDSGPPSYYAAFYLGFSSRCRDRDGSYSFLDCPCCIIIRRPDRDGWRILPYQCWMPRS